MKKLRAILSVVLSMVMLMCYIPFSSLVSAEEPTGTEYVIYKSNPFKAGVLGTDVSRTIASGAKSSRNPVYVASEEDGGYFTYSDLYATSGQNQWNRRHFFYMGYNDKIDGFGWMSNTGVTSKILDKITFSMKVRITATATSGTAPTKAKFHFNVANQETVDSIAVTNKLINNTSVDFTGEWIEFTVTPTAMNSFYSGYGVIWIEPDLFNGTLKVDIKDITFTINDNDKADIDIALKGTGWDFDSLVANYQYFDEEIVAQSIDYTVWEANADNLSAESGESVKANMASNGNYKPAFDVVKMTDDGNYYRSQITVSGKAGNGVNTVLVSGLNVNNRGYGWLEDVTVLQTIRQFMTVSFEYRVNAVKGSIPSDGYIYIKAAHEYNGAATSLCTVGMSAATEWTSKSVNLSGNTFASWYSGYLGFNIYSDSGGFNGSYNIDLRNFKVTLNSDDELAINSALESAGSLWKFDHIVQSDPQFNSHNSIWYASPERIGADVGDDVTGVLATPAKYATVAAKENGVDFYRTEMNVLGHGGDDSNAIFESGLNSDSKGFGWMANKTLLNALAPYMYISFDYRFTGTTLLPDDAVISFGAASSYGKICDFGTISGEARNWRTYQLAVNPDTFDYAWSDGYFTFSIYSECGGFTGKQYVDIRNLRIELRDCDRLAVNDALTSVIGIASVINFTKDIIRDRDETGSYNYYNTLINALPNMDFDANDDDIFDILDLVRMKKIAAGVCWGSDVITRRIDINGDDTVSSYELVDARQELLNSDSSPYANDPLNVSLVVDHPGVAEMDAYYELSVIDETGNDVSDSEVSVTTNKGEVTVDGYNLTIPYSVRSANETLTVTVTNKTDNSIYGRYDFDFVKFTSTPTLSDDFNTVNTDIWSEKFSTGKYEIVDGKLKFTSEVGQTVGLTTVDAFEQAYGSFSASIKMPEKALVNGAFWLYSNTGKTYRRNPLNPSVSGGEIDIVEYFPTWTNGSKWSSTVHWYGPSQGHRCYSGNDQLNADVDLGNDYHIYSAVWMKDAIYSYLDGVLYRVYDGEGISDHSDGMQIILSLHGNSEDSDWGGSFDASSFPDTMQTDWIKVYGLAE